jgi:hypothetical protein
MQRHEFAAWNWLDCIGNAIDIRKLHEHAILAQFINNGADLPLGEMSPRQILKRSHDIMQFHLTGFVRPPVSRWQGG